MQFSATAFVIGLKNSENSNIRKLFGNATFDANCNNRKLAHLSSSLPAFVNISNSNIQNFEMANAMNPHQILPKQLWAIFPSLREKFTSFFKKICSNFHPITNIKLPIRIRYQCFSHDLNELLLVCR